MSSSLSRAASVQGVAVPRFLYGTAWKEDATQGLVERALQAGVIGVDTANQRKHYHEAAVGEALRTWWNAGHARESVFVQTKFTFVGGQDQRLPYDAAAPIATQVRQSFERSLQHLGVDFIDSYVLHGPSRRFGLGDDDWAAWKAMESLYDAGKVALLGVSNVSLEQLQQLCDGATVPPAMVQNRCYARQGWNRDVRAFCSERGIAYQGFSLLTANATELRHPAITSVAGRLGRTPAQVVFRFALQVGMVCLTGTTDPGHLADDLACFDFELTPSEVAAIEAVG